MLAVKDVLRVVENAEDVAAECKAASGCAPSAEECFSAVRDGINSLIAARLQ